MKKALVMLMLGGLAITAGVVNAQNSTMASRGRIYRDSNNSAKHRVPYMDDTGPRNVDRPLYEVEQLEQQCFDEVNHQREGYGLQPLKFDNSLLPLARGYSKWMAEDKFFAHKDPEGHTVNDRASEYGIKWRVIGENLASSNGYMNPVAASLHGWMESPGHRKNILDSAFTQSAIGAWIADDGTVYFTQIFLRR